MGMLSQRLLQSVLLALPQVPLSQVPPQIRRHIPCIAVIRVITSQHHVITIDLIGPIATTIMQTVAVTSSHGHHAGIAIAQTAIGLSIPTLAIS